MASGVLDSRAATASAVTALTLLRTLPRPGTLEAEALVSIAETSRAVADPVTETVLGWTTLKPRNHVKLLCRLERTPQVLDTAAEQVVAQSKKPALKETDAEACVTAALALYESGDPRWVQHVLIQTKNWAWLLVELSRDERGLGSGQMLLGALVEIEAVAAVVDSGREASGSLADRI